MSENKVKAVIFDWAGTTVDYGCIAPAKVFVEVFEERGIFINMLDARKPMGMNKKDHIREILKEEHISALWQTKFRREWNENDIQDLYDAFIPKQLNILKDYSDLIPGVLEVQEYLKKNDIRIGSTTGYNSEMMEIVTMKAGEQGYKPDVVITSSDVPIGRPAPWMAIQAAMELGIYPFNHIIKVGDTLADISEGVNAGMWSVGVIESSNELGLSLVDFNKLKEKDLVIFKEELRNKYKSNGAHAVIDNLKTLPRLINKINKLINENIKPQLVESI